MYLWPCDEQIIVLSFSYTEGKAIKLCFPLLECSLVQRIGAELDAERSEPEWVYLLLLEIFKCG